MEITWNPPKLSYKTKVKFWQIIGTVNECKIKTNIEETKTQNEKAKQFETKQTRKDKKAVNTTNKQT